ncbi:MAG TPA: ethanolamine ammonia-lyase subunit EutC [Candidatus Competibacter sp.]|nr:ethanolamine ammonia-lyase [Candidatus Competibacteraceae bacterium]HRE55686.1 ethanolamine ammonia-lyase subunit EutC [Candidatus Competibacter sp.]HUM92958.1 ethanolamine ammonia-lyase subunit EutC [Candidatus Competibacter sp.]
MNTAESTPVVANPWHRLRRFTPARIALGRAGVSLPTQPQLEFQLAHARARDAVHLPFDPSELKKQLSARARETQVLHSAATDRHQYLQRPDLGRKLDRASRERLTARASQAPIAYDVAFVIADGLSALAVHQNAVPLIEAMTVKLQAVNWRVAPIMLVEQGRVAIGDEIGELLGVELVAVLIGERPGLSSPDSLGIYLSYQPRVGMTDAERNCISNVRPAGLSYATAAHKLFNLMSEARRRRLSGVRLKDETDVPPLDSLPGGHNFLVDESMAAPG